jgi:hypothetical protein
MEKSLVQPKRLKLVAAGIGAGAAVAMGALGAAFAQGPNSAGTISEGIGITLGETSTESVAPTELATTFASPTVTAQPPEGFGNGGS